MQLEVVVVSPFPFVTASRGIGKPLVPPEVVVERDALDAGAGAGAGGVAFSWLLFWRSKNRWFVASAFLLASSSSWSLTLSSSEDSRRGSRVASRWDGELMIGLEKREKELADSSL